MLPLAQNKPELTTPDTSLVTSNRFQETQEVKIQTSVEMQQRTMEFTNKKGDLNVYVSVFKKRKKNLHKL